MTTAKGTFTSCGAGNPFALSFTCTGPSCSDLNGFPGTTCTTDGTTLTCNSGITCAGPTNYTSEFSFSQTGDIVSQSQNVILKDCGSFTVTSDGTTGGTNVQIIESKTCPGSNSSAPSNGTSSSSSSLSSSSARYTNGTATLPSTASGSGHISVGTTVTVVNGKTTTICDASSVVATQTVCNSCKSPAGGSSTFTSTIPGTCSSCKASTATIVVPGSPTSGVPVTSPVGTPTVCPTCGSQPGSTNGAASNPPVTVVNGSTIVLPATSTVSASAKPAQFTGGAPIRRPGRSVIIVMFLFAISFLVQGSTAYVHQEDAFQLAPRSSASVELSEYNSSFVDLRDRDLGKYYEQFAKLFSEYLAGKLTTAVTPGGDGEIFADNVVAEIAEAVCDHFVGGAISTVLIGDLVETCISAIYTGNLIIAPELEFLSIFGASLLCNFAVNEAIPQIGQLTDALCKVPKPCGDLLTDPNNCGACGLKEVEPNENVDSISPHFPTCYEKRLVLANYSVLAPMFFPDTKLSAFYPSRNPNQHLQSSEGSSGSNSRNDRNRTAGGSWGFQLVKLAVLRRELPRPTSGEIKMMMTLLSPWEAVAFAVWLCDYNYLIRPNWQYSQLARTNIRDL
ncbi:MAG: hypothetical protein M1824_000486 [Vezdaea acicularis]|nr:MAG: hypothetical protein M1824_000486 [Vezdaea acicularis]